MAAGASRPDPAQRSFHHAGPGQARRPARWRSRTAASPTWATSARSCALAGSGDRVDRPARPARAAGPDRQPPAHHPRRAQLQHGAALGRRAQPRRRDGACSSARWPSRRAPQWVRVVGGFTEHQFAEKRLPTLDEINAVAPDTPVFLLHLYDRALLNGAALRAVGYTQDTPDPPGGEIARDGARQPHRACCWPSPTPPSSTPRSPRGRSCRSSTS